jgi:hypothetical protein
LSESAERARDDAVRAYAQYALKKLRWVQY